MKATTIALWLVQVLSGCLPAPEACQALTRVTPVLRESFSKDCLAAARRCRAASDLYCQPLRICQAERAAVYADLEAGLAECGGP